MFDRLSRLKILGYTPSAILDIGAFVGNWTQCMLKIYPTSDYYLFEANDQEKLDSYSNNHVHVYKNIILNEKVEEVDWYQTSYTGDSFCKENTSHYRDIKPVKRTTIDLNSFLEKEKINLVNEDIFLKIDCQGAEIPILKGSTNILPFTTFILIEIPFFGCYNSNTANFLEHIRYMDSIGFIPYDITSILYVNDFAMQLDMLFIKKGHRLTNIVQEKLL
jgi:FkbM family methyltransferase